MSVKGPAKYNLASYHGIRSVAAQRLHGNEKVGYADNFVPSS